MIKISTYDTFIKLIFQIIIQLIKTYNVITKKYMQDKIYEHRKFYYQLDNQTIFTTEKRSNIRILYKYSYSLQKFNIFNSFIFKSFILNKTL